MLTNETVKSDTLCETIKKLIAQRKFDCAEKDIITAMSESPHSAQPHNLMGILLEHKNNHCAAMKHFRAAWALDPTYRPAQINIDKYGSFGSDRFLNDAYDDSDCHDESIKKEQYKIEYDNHGIRHVIRR